MKYNIVGMLCNTVRMLSAKIVQKLEMAAKIGVTRKPRCASAPNGRAATPPRPVLRPRYDDSTSQPPEEEQMRGRQPAAGGAKEGLMARGGEQRQRKG